MASTQSSNVFWAKQFIIAIVLIIAAIVLIQFYQPETETLTVAPEPEQDKSVSKGLSDFYRELRDSSSELIKEELGDFVIELGDDDDSMQSRLENVSTGVRPVNKQWKGDYKYRTFKAGKTLREAISGYAQQEGMQLIWNLDQDFIIKYQFQMDNTIVGSLNDIASAIDANFDKKVSAYLCSDQRTLVITSEQSQYLTDNCSQLR